MREQKLCGYFFLWEQRRTGIHTFGDNRFARVSVCVCKTVFKRVREFKWNLRACQRQELALALTLSDTLY